MKDTKAIIYFSFEFSLVEVSDMVCFPNIFM